ncbi:hypothetical protein ADL03_31360 [Nocardia sp. NRRL S-836]|nr:hypothetical protein ADL03_31360 [Nocardia sp. NRRL S-836]
MNRIRPAPRPYPRPRPPPTSPRRPRSSPLTSACATPDPSVRPYGPQNGVVQRRVALNRAVGSHAAR